MLLDCILGSNSSWFDLGHIWNLKYVSIIRITHSHRSFSATFSSSKTELCLLGSSWNVDQLEVISCREVGLEWSMLFWEVSEAIFVLISRSDLMTGIYPPQVRVYEVSELSLKFERHLTSEIIDFQVRFNFFFLGSFCLRGTSRKVWNWVQSVAWKLDNCVGVAGTSRWLFQTGLFVRRSKCMVACKIWQLLQYSNSKVVIIHCTILSPNLECFLILRIIWSFCDPILRFC